MEEFLLSEAYSSRELLLFNKEYMGNDAYNDQTNIKFLKQKEFNTNIIKRLEELETKIETLQASNYETDIKLERIDDILVVHRNQNDTQRKNHTQLIKVFDEKVIPLIEGTHVKPRVTDAKQAIIDLNKTLFGEKPDEKQK